MPSTSPSARTDCPSTASRGDGQQIQHESGQPCPMPQESTTRPAPRPDGHAARRPYAVNLPAQIEQTEPAGEREDIRRGRRRARREKGRKDEDLRPLACRFAVKVIYRPNLAPNGQPSTAPGQQAPQPAPAEAPSLPTYSRPFLSLSILLLESLQNPGLFLPVSRRTTAPRPPAWTPPAPGEPSHFRARPVSHETTQYLYSITYTPYPHFSLGNNLDDSPTVNELNPYLQNHIFSLTTSVFLSTLYNSPRLQSYSSSIATKKTNILIDFRPQIW